MGAACGALWHDVLDVGAGRLHKCMPAGLRDMPTDPQCVLATWHQHARGLHICGVDVGSTKNFKMVFSILTCCRFICRADHNCAQGSDALVCALPGHSVHEQNFFLYFYGAAFNLLGVFGVMAFSRLSWVDVFRGHSLVRMPAPLCPATSLGYIRVRVYSALSHYLFENRRLWVLRVWWVPAKHWRSLSDAVKWATCQVAIPFKTQFRGPGSACASNAQHQVCLCQRLTWAAPCANPPRINQSHQCTHALWSPTAVKLANRPHSGWYLRMESFTICTCTVEPSCGAGQLATSIEMRTPPADACARRGPPCWWSTDALVVNIIPAGACVRAQVTFLLVVNNALQGVLSSFFFKYADTILKKYSSTVATIFTGVMSAALFGHALTLNFVLGVTIVFISMHQFFAQGVCGPPGTAL